MISLSIDDYDLKSPSVITIGTFDGIHLGHQKLINTVIDISKRENVIRGYQFKNKKEFPPQP